MLLPDDARRISLNDEVHARPPEPLRTPCRVSCLALLSPQEQRGAEWRAVSKLCQRFGVDPPSPSASHSSVDLGPFRLVFEMHTAFARYMFVAPARDDVAPFAEPAIAAVPADWLSGLPGRVIAASHVALVRGEGETSLEETARHFFGGNQSSSGRRSPAVRQWPSPICASMATASAGFWSRIAA